MGLPRQARLLHQHPPVISTVWSTPVWDGSYGAKTADLPESLIFKVSYLGGEMPTFRTELLPSGRTGTAAVLHVPAFGIRRVSKGAADFA